MIIAAITKNHKMFIVHVESDTYPQKNTQTKIRKKKEKWKTKAKMTFWSFKFRLIDSKLFLTHFRYEKNVWIYSFYFHATMCISCDTWANLHQNNRRQRDGHHRKKAIVLFNLEWKKISKAHYYSASVFCSQLMIRHIFFLHIFALCLKRHTHTQF